MIRTDSATGIPTSNLVKVLTLSTC